MYDAGMHVASYFIFQMDQTSVLFVMRKHTVVRNISSIYIGSYNTSLTGVGDGVGTMVGLCFRESSVKNVHKQAADVKAMFVLGQRQSNLCASNT
jgi:hypothetical protein